jgi:hypothetical protein
MRRMAKFDLYYYRTKGDKPMISNKQTATIEGDKQMNRISTNRQTVVLKESEMKPTTSNLIRWCGLAAMVAGIIYAGIQPIHPADVVGSVNTVEWAIITPLKTVMCFFFLLGLVGLYARQVKKIGWLGLIGFLLFSLAWTLLMAFIFAEAFIMPPLASVAPQFVDGFLGVAGGRTSEINLGVVPVLFALAGVLYILGGLLFGIANFRAGILPRRAAILLAATAGLTPLASLLPHNIQRLAAMPMGLALAWLGYALWSERRVQALESVPGKESSLLGQTETE